MNKNDIKIGNTYLAKVTGKVVPVRIDAENTHGGWDATNMATKKKVRIKSPQRLRRPADAATRKTIAGKETDMSKARKVVLGHVYSVAVGGSYLPVRADNGPCQGIISVYCTRCHTTERICDTLGSDEAAWKALIREMAEYDGDLDQETQNQVSILLLLVKVLLMMQVVLVLNHLTL